MARVEIVRESGRLMIVEIVGERFPVLPERPEVLSHIGHMEDLEDGRKICTGFREVNGVLRNVAWQVDEDEMHRIDRAWREAIAKSTIEVVEVTVTVVETTYED